MKRYTLLIILALSLYVMLSGCAPREEAGSQMDYDETKKMMIDILETDDGKKALQEVMKAEDMQQALIMDQKTVTETIQKTLTSEEGTKFWQKVFEDPKFVESFAKSLQEEHEKVIKGLMTDPEYQKLLIEVFQDPEMEKSLQTSLKSKEFREHLKEVISETLESPLYKAKIQETLLKAAEEAGKGEEKPKGDE
ncbi:spore germination lipoprotein GerD [Metabacillus niabensis]|uniref:Spore germination protein D n=1 Tax=Metabacillus niabensis TaxID=324854 RepID=A0ABT9ZBD4_9BACI|nr:spore germination lipoprotein GerD [Metabacillus niabensis]MDQ0228590.1 spore germination protein D [Metabacillus niabensis]PAD68051.1 spore gernimation protein GerD [Bacillus sp. 7586-K]